jgi:hypothetical protein
MLWAFTVRFFREDNVDLLDLEAGMAAMDQPVDAYLTQLSSSARATRCPPSA